MIPVIGDRLAAGDKLDLRLTVDGLRDLIQDQVRAGHRPKCIIISEIDRRDLNDDLMSESTATIDAADAADNHKHIAIIEGVPVFSNPEVGRGKARIIHAQQG